MWPWCSRVIEYIFGSLHQIQLTVVLRTSAVVIRCLCSPLGVLGVPLLSFLNSNKKGGRLYVIVDIIYMSQLWYFDYKQIYLNITECNIVIIIVTCI